MCQRSLGFVRGVFLCFTNLRFVKGVCLRLRFVTNRLSEECFCVLGVWGVSEEFGVCKRSVSVLYGFKMCQRSLGFVRDLVLCYRNLRCVRGVWGLSEECFRVIGI